MPAESSRLSRRLRPRDRWFLGLVVGAALVGSVVAVLTAGSGMPKSGPTCVTTIRPTFTGAGIFRYCGVRATAYCRRHASADSGLAAACERLIPRLRPEAG